jgi:hypothetical protein
MESLLMSFEKPFMSHNGEVIPQALGSVACCGKTDSFGFIVCCAH